MIPYFIVFAGISVIGFLIDLSKSRYIKYALCFFLLLIMLCLYYYRDYGIGTDTINYIPIFQDISNSNNIIDYSLSNNVEIGFSFLVYFINLFSQDYFLIFTILTSIIYINLIITVYRYNLSYILFFCSLFCIFQMYFYSFNILRQAIAISFVILATSYLVENKDKKFLILCFFAFIFHYSSVFVILFYFIYLFRVKIVNFWYLVLIVLLFALSFIFSYVIGGFDKYSIYDVDDSITTSGGFFLNLFYIVLFAIALLLKKRIHIMKSEFYFFLAIYTFYISLTLFYFSSPFLNQGMVRVSFYFLWPSIFIILIIIKNISNIRVRYFVSCTYYLFLISFTSYYLSNVGIEVVPYRFR